MHLKSCNPCLEKQHCCQRTTSGLLSGLKKSAQITTDKNGLASLASNVPHLWASTSICAVRWQARLEKLKNSLVKTNKEVYFSACSVPQYIHTKACASTRKECGNKWSGRRAGLPLSMAVLAQVDRKCPLMYSQRIVTWKRLSHCTAQLDSLSFGKCSSDC